MAAGWWGVGGWLTAGRAHAGGGRLVGGGLVAAGKWLAGGWLVSGIWLVGGGRLVGGGLAVAVKREEGGCLAAGLWRRARNGWAVCWRRIGVECEAGVSWMDALLYSRPVWGARPAASPPPHKLRRPSRGPRESLRAQLQNELPSRYKYK